MAVYKVRGTIYLAAMIHTQQIAREQNTARLSSQIQQHLHKALDDNHSDSLHSLVAVGFVKCVHSQRVK